MCDLLEGRNVSTFWRMSVAVAAMNAVPDMQSFRYGPECIGQYENSDCARASNK